MKLYCSTCEEVFDAEVFSQCKWCKSWNTRVITLQERIYRDNELDKQVEERRENDQR